MSTADRNAKYARAIADQVNRTRDHRGIPKVGWSMLAADAAIRLADQEKKELEVFLLEGIASLSKKLVEASQELGNLRRQPPQPEERPNWCTYFLGIAEAVSARADCTRSKVGAVLVNSRNEIRGTGYNGAPAGVPGCLSEGACPRGQHYQLKGADSEWCGCGDAWPCIESSEPDADYENCVADHAERNAIRHAPPDELWGATLYVTRPPCPSCITLIQACGIERVTTPGGEIVFERGHSDD